jgi:hypothetical protein
MSMTFAADNFCVKKRSSIKMTAYGEAPELRAVSECVCASAPGARAAREDVRAMGSDAAEAKK